MSNSGNVSEQKLLANWIWKVSTSGMLAVPIVEDLLQYHVIEITSDKATRKRVGKFRRNSWMTWRQRHSNSYIFKMPSFHFFHTLPFHIPMSQLNFKDANVCFSNVEEGWKFRNWNFSPLIIYSSRQQTLSDWHNYIGNFVAGFMQWAFLNFHTIFISKVIGKFC